jgi:hypothetical protein
MNARMNSARVEVSNSLRSIVFCFVSIYRLYDLAPNLLKRLSRNDVAFLACAVNCLLVEQFQSIRCGFVSQISQLSIRAEIKISEVRLPIRHRNLHSASMLRGLDRRAKAPSTSQCQFSGDGMWRPVIWSA